MTTTMNANEMKVFAAAYEDSSGNGHDFGHGDQVWVDGLSRHQVAGYFSALERKGLMECPTATPTSRSPKPATLSPRREPNERAGQVRPDGRVPCGGSEWVRGPIEWNGDHAVGEMFAVGMTLNPRPGDPAAAPTCPRRARVPLEYIDKVRPHRCEAVHYRRSMRCGLHQGHEGQHVAGSGEGETRWPS